MVDRKLIQLQIIIFTPVKGQVVLKEEWSLRALELCESRGGRPGFPCP